MSIFHYLCFGIIVIASIFTITMTNIVYALLSSMLVFGAVGCCFILLNSTYNAIIQFLIYFISIPLLIAISIIFTQNHRKIQNIIKNNYAVISIFGVILFSIILSVYVNINYDFLEITKLCTICNNYFYELSSISNNIVYLYPHLLLEFAIGMLFTIFWMVGNE